MSKETVLFTKEGLEELEQKLDYMVHGQGFRVYIIDAKPTRRRTMVNMLHKIGVEKVVEVESYVKAVNALKGQEDEVNIIISTMNIDKVNGLKFITDYIRKSPKSRGVIVVDNVVPQLQQVVSMSKLLEMLKRPFQEDDVLEVIRKFGIPL